MHPVPSSHTAKRGDSDDYQRRTLNWTCVDSSKIVAPLVRETLHTWAKKSEIHLQQRTTDWRPSGQQWLGLSVWTAWEASELDSLVLSLNEQRRANPAAIQVVVLSETCIEHRSRLVQAGAQVVVHPLSLFQRSLMIIADRLSLCYYDPNPLTQGLTQWIDLQSTPIAVPKQSDKSTLEDE